jgi:hypothetical protein
VKAKRGGDRRAFLPFCIEDRARRAFAHPLSKPFAEMTRSFLAFLALGARDSRSLLSGRSFAGIRDDVQTGRPKTIRPALALADFASKPGAVVINARLRTEALERSTMPHQTELAMTISAMIFHSLLPEWHLG